VPTEQIPALVSAGHAIARLARHLDVALSAHDLTVAQFRVLGLLADGSTGATLLADRLAVSAPNVTGLIDGLVGRGLVARRPDPGDRRRSALSLTAKGRRHLRAAERAVDARLVELAAHLGPDAVDPLLRSLARWEAALDLAREAKLRDRAKAAR
jgi:DNA-binding MarR family transcriptional regulator